MPIDRDKISLKEFIEKNQTLLSAEAVFAGLTALVSNLPIQWMSYALSFITVGGMIVVWWEIRLQLPKQMSPRLALFRYVLFWGLCGLWLYWLLEFREVWRIFLFFPLMTLFSYMAYGFLKPFTKVKIIRYIFGIGTNKSYFQKTLAILIYLMVFNVALNLTVIYVPVVNYVLDVMKITLP